MNNFEFQNPTRLIFGKGQIARLSQELPRDKKILVTFGGGSVLGGTKLIAAAACRVRAKNA